MSVEMMNKRNKGRNKIHRMELDMAPLSSKLLHFNDSHFRDRNINLIIIHHFLCLHLLYNKTLNPIDFY